jgi:predicted outer membrane protein
MAVLSGVVAVLDVATATAQLPPLDPVRFLAFAHSSTVMQARASELAAGRDTRPEVKAFASEMAQFRIEQLVRLRATAQARGIVLSEVDTFEHRVILENLEPLDYLALSRRYAEIEIQALTQEIQAYEAAAGGADVGLRQLAAQTLPQLGQHLVSAKRMHDAVKP